MSPDAQMAVMGLSLLGAAVSLLCAACCIYWSLDARKSAGREYYADVDDGT